MKHHTWTDDERDIVRRYYKGTHASARDIGHRLGVTEFAVRGQVQHLRLPTTIPKIPPPTLQQTLARDIRDFAEIFHRNPTTAEVLDWAQDIYHHPTHGSHQATHPWARDLIHLATGADASRIVSQKSDPQANRPPFIVDHNKEAKNNHETPAPLLLPERRQDPKAKGRAVRPQGRHQGSLRPNPQALDTSRHALPPLPPIHARNLTPPGDKHSANNRDVKRKQGESNEQSQRNIIHNNQHNAH